MSVYLVIAYRWGCTNGDWYVVYGGPDRAKACSLAAAEVSGRAHMFACAVYEFDDEGTDFELIAYEGSLDGEEEPWHNEYIEYLARLGHFMNHYASGKAWLPDPENPKVRKCMEVTPPQLVVEWKKRRVGPGFGDHALEGRSFQQPIEIPSFRSERPDAQRVLRCTHLIRS